MHRTSPLGVVLLGFLFLLVGFSQVWAQNALRMNQQPVDHKQFLTVDGRERSYVVHIPPAYNGRELLPLVIVLHGGGGNAETIMRTTGMSDKADKEGLIVVYPDGTGRLKNRLLTWNAGSCCGYAMEQNIDDVRFIRTLIENLQQDLAIDDKKIYATGMSNGAMMAYRLGCELSDKIAAIAPVAGSIVYEDCQPTHPLSVIIFHGTADEHVPYEGGRLKTRAGRGLVKSVADAVSFWVKHNQCSTTPLKQEMGNIVQEVYNNCKDDVEVALYTIKGGGHAWPGAKKGTRFGDEPTQEISATDLMLGFFLRHPKK